MDRSTLHLTSVQRRRPAMALFVTQHGSALAVLRSVGVLAAVTAALTGPRSPGSSCSCSPAKPKDRRTRARLALNNYRGHGAVLCLDFLSSAPAISNSQTDCAPQSAQRGDTRAAPTRPWGRTLGLALPTSSVSDSPSTIFPAARKQLLILA